MPSAETSAEPSLQAKQLQLKRARLADDLNDKISHRPGPIELVHKNILSVNCHLQHSLLGNNTHLISVHLYASQSRDPLGSSLMALLFLSNVIPSLSRWEGLIAPAINFVNAIVVSPVFHLLHFPCVRTCSRS